MTICYLRHKEKPCCDSWIRDFTVSQKKKMCKYSILFVLMTLNGLVFTDEIIPNAVNETVVPQINIPLIHDSNSSNIAINSNHNLSMLAKKENNLIVNGSGVSIGRNLSPEVQSVQQTATGSNAVTYIVVTVVIEIIVVGAVLGAIFFMKKRLFVFNLNNGEKAENNDGANAVLTNASNENDSVSKLEGAVENKMEIIDETSETKNDEVKIETQVEEKNQENPPEKKLSEQTTSTSLVVNVLNEIIDQVDPEKQPLNSNSTQSE
ncbi:unnamed protein product [Brachionus calyciflorus]|uniref:Uncharacterized protein n=1 Tax=Brachionus calyciflorus TaxID=104777 RepID=A0A814AVC4_9BILA|nr:unnamed protein product [Brachionus calyciflorus]